MPNSTEEQDKSPLVTLDTKAAQRLHYERQISALLAIYNDLSQELEQAINELAPRRPVRAFLEGVHFRLVNRVTQLQRVKFDD